MFTGIIEEVGKIVKIQRSTGGVRISITANLTVNYGDSVSVDGACLTVEDFEKNEFTVFLSDETLRRTHFSRTLREGLPVNLERSLTPSSFMGGHIVLGHVDCTGELYNKETRAEGVEITFKVMDPKYMKYVVEKGSIAVNGISLTCYDIKEKTFKVSIIPYTISKTNLYFLKEGDLVNLEFDIIAKYLEKLSRDFKWNNM
ncbi:MAG: riboflavin synthase [candidate division WOR-3 bacterium]